MVPSPEKLLAIYVGDHDAGATASVELWRRLARSRRGEPDGPMLATMAAEVVADRALLRGMFATLGAHPSRIKSTGAWLGEKAGRLKLNGSVVAPSPLGHVVDVEGALTLDAFTALAWRTLRGLAAADDRLDRAVIDNALVRQGSRAEALQGLRGARAAEAFRP